jgi:pyruvate/2-oxoglutarate dehydrogenase complex dihydrolipoamide acyltransferase (E2) component
MVQTVTLSLAADHRVMDGADAARLLQRITKHLNAPAGLLI